MLRDHGDVGGGALRADALPDRERDRQRLLHGVLRVGSRPRVSARAGEQPRPLIARQALELEGGHTGASSRPARRPLGKAGMAVTRVGIVGLLHWKWSGTAGPTAHAVADAAVSGSAGGGAAGRGGERGPRAGVPPARAVRWRPARSGS